MSDWSGERYPLFPDWLLIALWVLVAVQGPLIMLLGGTLGTLVMVLLGEAAAAGLGLVGWRLWPRVSNWRTDRELAREDADEWGKSSMRTLAESNHVKGLVKMDERPKLITGSRPSRPGEATVSLYCDECGELYCEHRDERGRPVEPDNAGNEPNHERQGRDA